MILDAVDSLLLQDDVPEVVVSHSGGGPTRELLARRRPSVRVLSTHRRRFPGAARNAGVAATRAPFVAFLAADCRASPGWVASRLARHRAGAGAVASALTVVDGCPPSHASHLLQHSLRMPHVEAPQHSRLGVSYARELLERHGPFPESLEFAEDSVLNARLISAGVEIEWAPEVITKHAYPTSVGALLRDQYRRSRRSAALRGEALWRTRLLRRSLTNAPRAFWRGAQPTSPVGATELTLAVPLLLAGAFAAAAGAWVGGPSTSAAEAELTLHRWVRSNGRRFLANAGVSESLARAEAEFGESRAPVAGEQIA
jgi:GT2 family glycosyltransferase